MATALGTNMSLEEMRTEAQARLDEASAIEAKHLEGAPPLTGAELEHVKRLLAEVDGLHAAIQSLEETRSIVDKTQQLRDYFARPLLPAQAGPAEGARKQLLTPGEQFIRDPRYRELKAQHAFDNSLNHVPPFSMTLSDGTSLLEWKATLAGSVAGSGGALVANDIRPGILEMLPKLINVLDLVPRLQTDSDQIEYVQQTVQTLNVGFVAEATGSALTGTDGRKPESALGFQTVLAPVRTAATWLPVTNRMLADAPAIRGIINSQLLMGLEQEVSRQVIAGDGSGENLTGILNTPGIQTFGRGGFNEVDAIFHARTLCRTGSKTAPTAILMNPVDYEQVRLLRENSASATLGQYLMGPPNTLGVQIAFGLPVVEDENVPVDTVVVANFTQMNIFDREQASIRVGLINDQLIRNQQTILAEQRLALVVWRPAAFVRITGY
jgi:HK97 family phage major capsid protein